MGDRQYKYINYSKSKIKNNDLKIDVKFDINELDLLARYVVSDNKAINRGSMINMRNLFGIIDLSSYDSDRKDKIDYILKGIDARLTYNLTSGDMVRRQINGGLGTNNIDKPKDLNNSEVEWISNTVSAILKDSIIYNDIDKGLELFTKFKATDYKDRRPIVREIEEFIVNLNNKFRRAKVADANDIVFSLSGERFVQSMLATYDKLADPANQLQFGVQALNALTGGGVESGRVYTILGLPSEGKSSTLLDMAIQIKRYNKNYICKDPTKKPCVVLLIMENGTKESIQRIFSMCVGKNMTDFNREDICNVLNNNGHLKLTEDDPIDIIIKFKPNLSEDTSYLYTLVEDLEDEGYETICLIQDYLKRIRSAEGNFGGDQRQQYGAIINEFKIFATLKDIPVITASQLNRVATASIDEARVKNKADLVRLIGRSNVGESNLILENSDWICIITPEYDKNGTKYLGIQRVKSRYYIPGNFQVAYIPYIGDSIKFVEDLGSVPMHKETLKDNAVNDSFDFGRGITGTLKNYDEIVKEQSNDNNDDDKKSEKKDEHKPNMFLGFSGAVAYNLYKPVYMCTYIPGFDHRQIAYYKPPLKTMCTLVKKKPLVEMCTLVG